MASRRRNFASHLNRILYLLIWVIGTKREYDGIRVRTWYADDEAGEPSAKVGGALSLIRAVSPKRYRDLQADFRGILLWELDGPLGQWRNDVRLCVLDKSYVERADPERLAMTIVHEATHAKMFRFGLGYPEALRPRIERVCVRASAAFARRLDNSSELQAELSQKPVWSDDYWSDSAFRERQLRRFDRLSAPDWLKRFVRWRVARRNRSAGTPNKR